MEVPLILFFDFVLFVKAIFDEGSTKTYTVKLCKNSGEILSCRGGGKITDVNISTIMNDLDQKSCTHSEGTIINDAKICVSKSKCTVNNYIIDFPKFNNRTLKLKINYRCFGKDGSARSKDVCPGDLMRDITCTGMESIKIMSVKLVQSKCLNLNAERDNYCNVAEFVIKSCDNLKMCRSVEKLNITYRWDSCFTIPKLVNIDYSCSAEHLVTDSSRIKTDTAQYVTTDSTIIKDDTDTTVAVMQTTTVHFDNTYSTLSTYMGVSIGAVVFFSVAIACVCYLKRSKQKLLRQEHLYVTTTPNIQPQTNGAAYTELRILPAESSQNVNDCFIQAGSAEETNRLLKSTKQSTINLKNENQYFLVDPKETEVTRKQNIGNIDNKDDNTERPEHLINGADYAVLDPTITGFNRSVTTFDPTYGILDPNETGFYRTGIKNPLNPNEKLSYTGYSHPIDSSHICAASQQSSSMTVQLNTDTNIYSHAVDDIYDESQHARHITLYPNYDHFFVQTNKQEK